MLRARLEVIRGRLLELEDACPPGHVAGVADALEALEDELVTLGWQPPPLSDRDVEVLISLGCQP